MELHFPPRDQWVAQRQTARKSHVSAAIMDYASPEEVAQLKAALRERFKQLGEDYHGEDLRYRREGIRQAIRLIEHGQLPKHAIDGAEDLIRASMKRLRTRLRQSTTKPKRRPGTRNCNGERNWKRDLEARYDAR